MFGASRNVPDSPLFSGTIKNMIRAFSRAMPGTTPEWEEGRFANTDDAEFYDDDSEELSEEELSEDVYADGSTSIYSASPQYAQGSDGFFFDPRLRGITVSPSGGVSKTAVPILNTVVNPVENLSNRIPMPTLASPSESADVSGAGATRFGDDPDAPAADAECCAPYKIGRASCRERV